VIFKRTENKQDDECATQRRTYSEGWRQPQKQGPRLEGPRRGLILGGAEFPRTSEAYTQGVAEGNHKPVLPEPHDMPAATSG
jgi:hypothetical protein